MYTMTIKNDALTNAAPAVEEEKEEVEEEANNDNKTAGTKKRMWILLVVMVMVALIIVGITVPLTTRKTEGDISSNASSSPSSKVDDVDDDDDDDDGGIAVFGDVRLQLMPVTGTMSRNATVPFFEQQAAAFFQEELRLKSPVAAASINALKVDVLTQELVLLTNQEDWQRRRHQLRQREILQTTRTDDVVAASLVVEIRVSGTSSSSSKEEDTLQDPKTVEMLLTSVINENSEGLVTRLQQQQQSPQDSSFFQSIQFIQGGDGDGDGGGTVLMTDDDVEPTLVVEDYTRWASYVNGTGLLSLEVWNAMKGDQWDELLATVVADWNQSSVLDLSIRKVEFDFGCSPVPGVIKVCNGDYRDTKWRGISESLVFRGLIEASTVKLNEFYFDDDDRSEAGNKGYIQRRYTLCHHFGHGFGLPHTDEDFFNEDLGNCLDYTNTPENNLNPGQFNFDLLQTIYGP